MIPEDDQPTSDAASISEATPLPAGTALVPYPDQLRAKLAALRTARYGGVRKIRFHNAGEERETEFKSDAEMAGAILALERDIALLEGTSSTRAVIVRSSKGW